MNDHAPIYSVTIDAKGVALGKIERGRRGYRKARKNAILRQRDAIELYRKLKTAGRRFDGTYHFHFLDTARTFAVLRLKGMEQGIQDNLDQVLAYDGSKKAGGR